MHGCFLIKVLGVLSLEVCEMHTQNPSFQSISTAFSLHKDMKIQVRTKQKPKTQNHYLRCDLFWVVCEITNTHTKINFYSFFF